MSKFTISQKQLVTLAATIGTCCLMGIEKTQPAHSVTARKVKATHEAIAALAKLTSEPLTEEMMAVGVGAWNAAMDYVAAHIKEDVCQQ